MSNCPNWIVLFVGKQNFLHCTLANLTGFFLLIVVSQQGYISSIKNETHMCWLLHNFAVSEEAGTSNVIPFEGWYLRNVRKLIPYQH